MNGTTKTLLGLAVAGLAAGLLFSSEVIKVQDHSWLYVALPAGAIFFGFFLISKLLEKETARFDEEQRAARLIAERAQAAERESPQEACGSPSKLSEHRLAVENAS